MKRPEIDAFDARILTLLQHDNRMTAQAMAEAVDRSPTACQKRMKRLRASGIVDAEVAVLSPEAVGLNVTAVVQVRVERDSREELDRFKQKMLAAPEVTHCYYVTGEHNFVVIVALPDMTAYERFSQAHFIENAEVTHFITSVVMDRVKTGGVLHVVPDEAGEDA